MLDGSKSDLLITACQEGKLDQVVSILKDGVDPNITVDIDGRTPLIWAAIKRIAGTPLLVKKIKRVPQVHLRNY
ncbi:MAG: ankyrin repeat domain-containing protein [Proteobacteria bacterium]|nr:ankyrin repeat domain-containing protein [Pseudomonadota bacterium]